MGDRGGGREAKGTSLKNSKKNPGSTAAKVKKEARTGPMRLRSEPPPRPIEGGRFFDCGAALLSRQFDRDRDRVISRAQSEGQCSSIVTWSSDIEKQQALADLAKINPGFCYFTTGIHPDNIDRTNMKSHKEWLEKIEDLGRRPECLGVITGLNLAREMGTHFAQESLLKSTCEVAERLELPIVLHCPDIMSLERAVENLKEVGWTADSEPKPVGEDGAGPSPNFVRKVIVHDIVTVCGGNPTKIPYIVDSGLYCTVSAAGISELELKSESWANAVECVKRIPRNRLLMGSDSPWKSPQNHPDKYFRTFRNEPANCPFVVAALSEALEVPISEMEAILKDNAWSVFGLDNIEAPVVISTPSLLPHSGSGEGSLHSSKSSAAGGEQASSSTSTSKSAVELTAAARKKKENSINEAALLEKRSATRGDDDNDDEAPPAQYYSCHKCRHFLFSYADVYNHGIDALKTVFKAGEQGLCQSTIFLMCTDDRGRTISRPGMSIPSSNVECKGCGQKLGKYSAGDSPCACGALVKGPSIRISAPKVDFNDKTVETQELIARSRIEVDQALAQEQLLLEENELKEEEERLSRKERKKKSQPSQRGGGNFSEFRNKSFQPNQSRKVVSLTEEQHKEMAIRDAKIKEDLLKKKKNLVTLQNLEKSKGKNSNANEDEGEVDGNSNSDEGNGDELNELGDEDLEGDFDEEDIDETEN